MTKLNQMDFFPSTSSQADTLANLSPSQVEKKVKKIQDTSGQKCLDLSKNSDRLGLLERTLVDTLNSVSTPYLRTWRVKVTPQGRLVFQLRASAQTTKEKESGLWLTPSKTIISNRSEEGMKKRAEFRKSIGRNTVNPGNLAEQVKYGKKVTDMKMWRTPDNMAGGSNLPGIKKALNEGHLKRPSGHQLQIRLQDQVQEKRLWPTPRASAAMNENLKTIEKRVMKKGFLGAKLEEKVAMWPTPNASDNRDRGNLSDPAVQRRIAMGKQVGLTMAVKEQKGGGTLNPTWVEWLMGYPSGWTDLSVSETVSSHKSPTTSDLASSELTTWPTPAARSFKLPRKPETMAKTKRNPLTNTLEDAVQHREMFPTPLSRDYKDLAVKPSWKEKKQKNLPVIVAERMWDKNDK